MWTFAIDTGGTFTDVLATAPDGARQRLKLLSHAALRGRVRQVESGGRRVSIDAPWSGAAALCGCRLSGLAASSTDESTGADPRIQGAVDGAFELTHAVDLASGQAVEVRSDEPAPLLAMRLLTGTAPGADFPPLDVRLATTRGTNALLERSAALPALFVTHGFADLLRIGDQRRPDLFALAVVLPEPLYGDVVDGTGAR